MLARLCSAESGRLPAFGGVETTGDLLARSFAGDREAAFKLAFAWGDEIPVGILYLSRRPAFEHQQPALRRGSLVAQFAGT